MNTNGMTDGIQAYINLINKIPFIKARNMSNEDKDLNLIYKIQPKGGIKPNENFLTFGNGYLSCIHIYAAPEEVERYWLLPLFHSENVITSISCRTLKLTEVKENIKRSMEEYYDRYENSKDFVEAKEANSSINKLNEVLNEISTLGNKMIAVDIRLYVVGKTFYELENNIQLVEKHLEEEGFAEFSRNINEQLEEYKAMFISPTLMQQTLNARPSLPVPANILAQALPNYYVGWDDPNGYYLGDTWFRGGHGTVMFDPFRLNKQRTCYDGFITGAKGSGKSTQLKVMIENTLTTGNKIRIIDVTGEFEELVNNLYGTVIKFGEGNSRLNPLEILRIDEDDTINYQNHISKMSLMYEIKNPKATTEELDLYKHMIKQLYVDTQIIDNIAQSDYNNITGLDSKSYPILSDLLGTVEKEIEKQEGSDKKEADYKIKLLFKIRSTITDLVTQYGSIFNGHTNIPNLLQSDIISFNLKNLVNLDSKIFDMELFNVLTIAYDSCMTEGTKMKRLYDSRQISAEDATHHLIILDECHKTINVEKPAIVKRILDIMRQDRKYFIGVWLSTQNLTDMYQYGNTEAAKDMKKMYENCQYKMIFKQENSAIKEIQEAFKNVFTELQIESIPMLDKQEMIFSLSSTQSIRLRCKDVSPERLSYYGGGA